MTDIKPFLFTLLNQPGLSGYEGSVSAIIAEKWQPLVDDLSVSPLGSLHGIRKAATTEKRPTLMIAAHMDAIGLMVKQLDHGLLRITQIGGIDPRILPGQQVTVHGVRDIPGVVQLIPDRLLNGSDPHKAPKYERLFIDTGLNEKELSKLVKPGMLVSFSQLPVELSGEALAGRSLDNRASVAALTMCLEEIQNYQLGWNVVAAATTQEEIGAPGAATSAFDLKPDLALVVDVTFAKGPGTDDYRSFPLGGGPSIGTGPNNHPVLTAEFARLADELDMPYSYEAMPESSGTDGMRIQISGSGIPLVVLGIAIRNMHTTVEMVDLKDIRRVARLMARFITSLNEKSMLSLFAEYK